MLIETLAAVALASGPASTSQQQRVAPRGNYRETCSGSYVNQGRLYADCRDERNRVVGTSIELNRCGDYEIQNRNGLLVCGPYRGDYESGSSNGGRPERPDRPGRPEGPGGWNPGPGGGWNRGSITVYSDAQYRGQSQTYTEEVSNLRNTGMNDRISSIQLRGAWEVCTDAYFRGSCQIISQDVWNLRDTGLNDRISSMRPASRY